MLCVLNKINFHTLWITQKLRLSYLNETEKNQAHNKTLQVIWYLIFIHSCWFSQRGSADMFLSHPCQGQQLCWVIRWYVGVWNGPVPDLEEKATETVELSITMVVLPLSLVSMESSVIGQTFQVNHCWIINKLSN